MPTPRPADLILTIVDVLRERVDVVDGLVGMNGWVNEVWGGERGAYQCVLCTSMEKTGVGELLSQCVCVREISPNRFFLSLPRWRSSLCFQKGSW